MGCEYVCLWRETQSWTDDSSEFRAAYGNVIWLLFGVIRCLERRVEGFVRLQFTHAASRYVDQLNSLEHG